MTFLLTDIEGSTRLWETAPEAMEVALERHNRLVARVIEEHGGVVVTSRGEGDSVFAVFPSAVSAVEAAGVSQLRLAGAVWPPGAALRVRMGLHTGEAHVREGDYVDHAPINGCARVKAAAHGGQVLATGLARQTRAPALVASGLLAIGMAVAETDPEQARACLRESRELSAALGYSSAIDLVWATAIASLTHDRADTLELGRRAIRGLQCGVDRMRMSMVLHIIAAALTATRPAAAAIIQGAAETYAVAPPGPARVMSSAVTEALGEERARELRGRGAGMDWDQALAYTLTQATQALNEPELGTQL